MVIWVRVAGNKRSVSYSRRRKFTGQGRKEMLAKGQRVLRDRLNGNIAPDGQVTNVLILNHDDTEHVSLRQL